MATKKTKENKLPDVLSVEKCMEATDGIMENVMLHLRGLRTVQDTSNNDKNNIVNLQKSEYAIATDNTVTVTFKLTTVPLGIERISQCSNKDFYKQLKDLFSKKEFDNALKKNSEYIAYNILNGRWLWRNKEIVESVDILIKDNIIGETIVELEDVNIPTNIRLDDNGNVIYENIPEEVKESIRTLSEILYKGFIGERKNVLEVTAILHTIEGEMLYPSQTVFNTNERLKEIFNRYKINLDKKEGDNIRLFYIVPGKNKPGLTSDKIKNALRTYDVWYPGYKDMQEPISIEITGGNLKFQEQFRSKKEQFSGMLKEAIFNDGKNIKEEDWLYMVGCFIRGGVPAEKKEAK